MVWQGVTYWAEYMNAKQGGMKYGNVTQPIEVFTRDASSVDSTLLASTVATAYKNLITLDGCNLAASPYTAARINAAVKTTEQYQIINLANAGLVTLTNLASFKYAFSWGLTSVGGANSVIQQLAKVAKTYVVFTSTDTGTLGWTNGAIAALNAKGLTMLRQYPINMSAVDSSNAVQVLIPAITEAVKDITPDIFVCSLNSDIFPQLVAAMEVVKPNINSAVFLATLWSSIQATLNLGQTGNGWMGLASFHDQLKFEGDANYGGSSQEFVQKFTARFGESPKPYTALTASMLMSYSRAVDLVQTTNQSVVRDAMLSMGTFKSFAGNISYGANHSNLNSVWYTFQLVGGKGKIISTQNDLIYPAPFPWKKTTKIPTTLITAVAVPVVVVIILVALFASFYVRRQRRMVVSVLQKTEEGERRAYKIDFNALETDLLLGSGSFGHVFKGLYRGTAVAVKKLKKQTMTKKQLDEFASEAGVMVGLRNPNIILFMGVCLEPSNLCIITELAARGSLYDVYGDTYLPFSVKIKMACDTLRGLQFIHSAGFVHRDLKSPNLLVDKNWNIKIADFGLSCAKGHASGGEQVSLLWTAPEVLQQEQNCYSDKSDVYSFAIILWELMAQKLPFDGLPPPAIHASVVHGKRPLVDLSWDYVVQKAITSSWEKLPTQRATISNLRNMLEGIPIDESEVPVVGTSVIRSASALRTEYCPRGLLVLAFLHIPDEPELWMQAPRATFQAIAIYKDLVRAHTKNLKGVEMPQENDGFTIAFPDIATAVNFCLRIQYDLISSDWPAALSSVSCARDDSGKMLKGLRISMCVHYGAPNLQGDNVNKMACSGALVDEGNYIVQCAAGGQILITTEAKNQLITGTNFDAHIIESFSAVTIPSHKEPLFVYEIASKELTSRLGMRSSYFNSLNGGVIQTYEKPAAPSWIIPYEDIAAGNLLGTGVSGDVYQATWKRKQVAVKKFAKQKYNDRTLLELKAETAELSELDHENVVKLHGVCIKPSYTSLVYELVSGNLSNLLRASGASLSWDIKLRFAVDIATGLDYLHKHNVIHRDLRSAKILVSGDYSIKIGGFGFANMKAENHTMTQVGTVAWTSPEIFNAEPITEKSDIFSFAIILWELVFCAQPWEGMHTMKVINEVTAGNRPPGNPPPRTPESILKMMRSSWAQDPTDRPTATIILSQL